MILDLYVTLRLDQRLQLDLNFTFLKLFFFHYQCPLRTNSYLKRQIYNLQYMHEFFQNICTKILDDTYHSIDIKASNEFTFRTFEIFV